MRVGNVIEEGKLGGPQIRIVRVSEALRETVDTVVIMPKLNSSDFRQLCEKSNIEFRAFHLTRITKELWPALTFLLTSPYEVLRLAFLFRKERLDLVHASGGSWQYKAILAARLAGVPSVWHLNDTKAPGFIRWVFKKINSFANGFIFASYRTEKYYRPLIKREVPSAVVPAALGSNFFIDDRDDSKKSFSSVEDRTPVVGAVANVNPVKGFEALIDAASLLREDGTEFQLRVGGAVSRRQRNYFDGLCERCRRCGVPESCFVGAISSSQMFLEDCDIFVCSSVAEASPMAVWEAMAMGLPIVSTDVGDVARHVQGAECGFVVDVGDSTKMAYEIKKLIEDEPLRRRMGASARVAAESFDPRVIGEKTSDIYQRIVHGFRKRNIKK